MKQTHIVVTLFMTIAIITACSKEQKNNTHQENAGHQDHNTTEQHATGIAGMVLNNGAKWPMDEHTRASFAKMVGSFLKADHKSLEGDGLKQVGAELQVELDGLIQGCTMIGEAHNQLHVYLTGYIPAVQALSKTGNLEDAKTVKYYLESYADYFE